MKFRLAKTKEGVVPVTDEDRNKWASVEYGEVFECRGLDQRNVGFHRKFFVMINLAWNNLPEHLDGNFANVDQFRKELIRRAGYYHHYKDFKGNDQYPAKSIAFDKMGQHEFEQLYGDVMDVILKWVLPVEKTALEQEILNLM